MPLAALPHANKYDRKDSPAEKEMRVRTREHVRNEGSRRFKSAPLPTESGCCGNLREQCEMTAFVARFERPTEPEKAASRRRAARSQQRSTPSPQDGGRRGTTIGWRAQQWSGSGLEAGRRHIHTDRRCGETKPIPVTHHHHEGEHEKR